VLFPGGLSAEVAEGAEFYEFPCFPPRLCVSASKHLIEPQRIAALLYRVAADLV